MSALIRCTRFSKVFSRSLHNFNKNAVVKWTRLERNLFENHTKSLFSRKEALKRFYTVSTVESTAKSTVESTAEGTAESTAEGTAESTAEGIDEKYQMPELNTNHHVFRLSEDSPANRYWKSIDFKLYERGDSFEDMCHDMFRTLLPENRRKMTPDIFYKFMCHVEQKESFTYDELFLILKTLGLENRLLNKHQKQRWTEYLTQRFVSLGVPLSVVYYNQVARNYLQTGVQFSPVEFMSAMEKQNVAPNEHLLGKMVEAYCKYGEVKAASQILEHMRTCEMMFTPVLYKRLIFGNFIAGDKETAMKLFNDAGNMGFDSRFTFYLDVVHGHAILGDFEGMKQIMKEAIDDGVVFNDSILSYMLEKVAQRGHQEIFDYLLEQMISESTLYYNTALDTLPVLLEQGNHDMAYRYFKELNDPTGTMFYRCMLFAELSPEDVVKLHRKLKADNVILSSLLEYFATALITDNYEAAVAVLPYFEKEDEEFRPQMLWPLINYYTTLKDLEGLKKILAYMDATSCGVTIPRLISAFESFRLSNEEVKDVLTENTKLSPGQINACIMCRFPNLRAALEYAKTCDTIEDLFTDEMPLIGAKLTFVTRENWKDILELMGLIKNCPPFVKQFVLRKVFSQKIDLQEVKEVMLETNVKVLERSLPETFKEMFSEKELEKVVIKRISQRQLMEMSFKELVELSNEYSNLSFYTDSLLNKSFWEGNWTAFRKTLQTANVNQLDINTQHNIARFYLREGNATKGLQIMKELKTMFPDFKPNKYKVVDDMHMLLKARKYEGAAELLTLYQYYDSEREGRVPQSSPETFFGIESVLENVEVANRILTTLLDNGYVVGEARTYVLVSYWGFISSVGDLQSIFEALENLRRKHNFIPADFSRVFLHFIKSGDNVQLQTAYDKFTDYVLEQGVLLSLAAAFIENGQTEKARKTLFFPGMKILTDNFRSICNGWIRKGQTEYIKEMIKIVGGLPAGLPSQELRLINLKTLCSTGDVDAVTEYFDEHVGENVLQNIEACRYYVSFLERRGRKVPLDKYTLQFVKERQNKTKTNPSVRRTKNIAVEKNDTQTTDIATDTTTDTATDIATEITTELAVTDIATEIDDKSEVAVATETPVDIIISEDVPVNVVVAEKEVNAVSDETKLTSDPKKETDA